MGMKNINLHILSVVYSFRDSCLNMQSSCWVYPLLDYELMPYYFLTLNYDTLN